jgi:hypothetical protein
VTELLVRLGIIDQWYQTFIAEIAIYSRGYVCKYIASSRAEMASLCPYSLLVIFSRLICASLDVVKIFGN